MVKRSYRHLKPHCRHVTDDKIAIKPEHILNYQKNKITNEFREVEAINYTIVDKRNYIYSNLAEDIYKNYAPCKFIYPYKYKVFNLTGSEKLAIDGNIFFKQLEKCDSLLHLEYFDFNYNITFSKLVMAIDFFNDENLIANYWKDIKQPLHDIWFTYIKGLRINNHEEYYDSKKQLWSQIYKKSLYNCNHEVNMLLKKVANTVDSTNYQHYTSDQEKLLNATIGTYLRDD